MTTASLACDLEQALAEVPMFDVHAHLVVGRYYQPSSTSGSKPRL
jgi:hypothetical protein